MDKEIIITGIVGIISSGAASLFAWFQARKKYKAEVVNSELTNLKDSIVMYKTIITDINSKLDYYIKLAKKNQIQVIKLNAALTNVVESICTKNTCAKRAQLNEEQLLKLVNSDIVEYKENENGYNTEENPNGL